MVVLACFDIATTWHLYVDEKLRRDLSDGSAQLKIPDAPGAYVVDWWSSVLGEDWEPIEHEEFDDVDEPEETSHLAEGADLRTSIDRTHLSASEV